MTIWNLGSINADFIYSVPHLPVGGETLTSTDRLTFLGGKGANMSVAVARAAGQVHHIGAVGHDGLWLRDRLLEYGVDVRHVATLQTETAQAIILVAADGENSIVLHRGANGQIALADVQAALSSASTGDWLLLQNETNQQVDAARLAKRMGLRICYAAAPYEQEATAAVLPYLDLLMLNEVEAAQFSSASGVDLRELPVADIIVTEGAAGATWYHRGQAQHFDAHKVNVVDTTGAGDTFTGYVVACLDRGQPMAQAISTAMKAAALMVQRRGTADVIPDLADVRDFTG